MSWELATFGLCELENVHNPDGSPAHGAYYYITSKGLKYLGPKAETAWVTP